MDDLISRQAAIAAIGEKPFAGTADEYEYEQGLQNQWERDVVAIKILPTAQSEELTDDDFETIRIHLSAIKEELCNQHRWKEAEEYQRIIDRFMAFAFAQPEREKARWIGKPIAGYCTVQCSVCKDVFSENNGRWNFCPTCGADMREGNINDQTT